MAGLRTCKMSLTWIVVGRDPLGYKKVVSEINRIDGALDGVNGLMKYEFKPSLPDRLFQAGAISRGDGDPPLRVLSCGKVFQKSRQ